MLKTKTNIYIYNKYIYIYIYIQIDIYTYAHPPWVGVSHIHIYIYIFIYIYIYIHCIDQIRHRGHHSEFEKVLNAFALSCYDQVGITMGVAYAHVIFCCVGISPYINVQTNS